MLNILSNEAVLISWIEEDDLRMRALYLAASLDLPDYYIAAGFVRNLIWDKLHNFDQLTELNDIDLIYFDGSQHSKSHDDQISLELKNALPLNWSVKNQARMHLRNQDKPYCSSLDAMRYWPEIETAIGVRLNKQGLLEIAAPFGLDGMFELNITINQLRAKPDVFRRRINDKRWLDIWPKLTVKPF